MIGLHSIGGGSMRQVIQLFSGLVFLAISQAATAARPLSPPIEELMSSPELTRMVVAVASEKAESPRIRFDVSERLLGESPDELVLRTDEDIWADVKTGQVYVLGWTDQRKVRLLREGYELDPDGPSLVKIRGLQTKALFRDSPEIRFLFSSRDTSAADADSQEIDALLGQLQRDDPRSQDLVAGQLVLKISLAGQMNGTQVGKLREILQQPGLGTQNLNFLFQTALRLPEEKQVPWLAEEFRKNIIQHGTQYDLTSYVPGLVLTSARGLGQVGEPGDADLLGILLYANNPGVAEAALKSMDKLDPEAAVAASERAIERGWISDPTRRTLERFLSQKAAEAN